MSDSLKWVQARASGSSGGNCVEVAANHGNRVMVRDTKNIQGPVLQFSSMAWRKFASRVKADASLSSGHSVS